MTAPTAARLAAPGPLGPRTGRCAGAREPPFFLPFDICERAWAFASARLRGRARREESIEPPWVPRGLRRRRFFFWAIRTGMLTGETPLYDLPRRVEPLDGRSLGKLSSAASGMR